MHIPWKVKKVQHRLLNSSESRPFSVEQLLEVGFSFHSMDASTKAENLPVYINTPAHTLSEWKWILQGSRIKEGLDIKVKSFNKRLMIFTECNRQRRSSASLSWCTMNLQLEKNNGASQKAPLRKGIIVNSLFLKVSIVGHPLSIQPRL
ncbi:hypothetical protein DITRI_Ditri13aG0161600 [Diplodiscus trichospermus]